MRRFPLAPNHIQVPRCLDYPTSFLHQHLKLWFPLKCLGMLGANARMGISTTMFEEMPSRISLILTGGHSPINNAQTDFYLHPLTQRISTYISARQEITSTQNQTRKKQISRFVILKLRTQGADLKTQAEANVSQTLTFEGKKKVIVIQTNTEPSKPALQTIPQAHRCSYGCRTSILKLPSDSKALFISRR